MTVLWHVDDLKASHEDKEVLLNFVDYLRSIMMMMKLEPLKSMMVQNTNLWE